MRRRSLRRRARRLAAGLLDLLLPSDCFVCLRPLGCDQHLGACPACWCGLQIVGEPFCSGCGLPRPEATDLLGPAGGRCVACLLSPTPARAVRAAVVYDHRARRFLLRAKLGLRPELMRPLGLQLAAMVRGWKDAHRCSVVVPVPSHPWSTLRRGFAPAHEIARAVADAMDLPLARRLLARRLSTGPATKTLGLHARASAARGSLHARAVPAEARVLLVDDVMTTGSTVQAGTRALLADGAASVTVAVWARTPSRGHG